MNKTRRKALEKVQDKLLEAQADLQWIREEEEDAFDNLPESLQDSEKGESMQEAISTMEEIDSSIQDAIDNLSELV